MSTPIYDGTFVGPTSAGAAGNTTSVADVAAVGTAHAWTDVTGSLFSIDSSGNLVNPGGTLSGWLTRPTGEAMPDQSIDLYFTYSGTSVQVGAVLKRVGTNGYLFLLNTGPGGTIPNTCQVYPMVGGVNVGGGNLPGYTPPTWVSGHNYKANFKSIGTNPVTLSATVSDLTASTVIATGSTDTTNASIEADGTCGVADWSVMSGTLVTSRVVINNESLALVVGPLAFTSTSSSITPSWSAAVGGSLMGYSYDLYRHTTAPFTPPGTGTHVGSTSSLSLVDSSPGAADVFYRLVVTDSLSATAASTQNGSQTALVARVTPGSLSPWKIGFIGDSITALAGPAPTMVAALSSLQPNRAITDAANAGSGGTKSGDWLIGGGLLPGAITAFLGAGVTHVNVMLGTNDAPTTSTLLATYLANLAAMSASLVSNGWIVVLHAPPYTVPGSRVGQDEAISLVLISYRDSLSTICNGTTILLGDVTSFDFFNQHQDQLSDGIHPDSTGQTSLGNLWATGFINAVLPHGGGGGTPNFAY